MADFLDTTGVSYRLQQLINNAKTKLILISPFLKINKNIRMSLDIKSRQGVIAILFVYGKSDLQPDEVAWLDSQNGFRLFYCENLHAKCYINEREAIITSMNLYEFSQVNNQEMGIYVSSETDSVLYNDIVQEAERLIGMSDPRRITVETVVPKTEIKVQPSKTAAREETRKTSAITTEEGHCVHCAKSIPLDPKHPWCRDCYKRGMEKDNNLVEKYCHACGKVSSKPITFKLPMDIDCYHKHEHLFLPKKAGYNQGGYGRKY